MSRTFVACLQVAFFVRLQQNYCAIDRGIGGVHIAENLGARSLHQLFITADVKLRSLFLSLIAIEDPKRKINADAEVGVDRRVASYIESDGGIGRSIRPCQAMVGLCFIHRLQCRHQIRASGQSSLPDFIQRRKLLGKIKRSSDIELFDRGTVIE